jgi:hypothetical protein
MCSPHSRTRAVRQEIISILLALAQGCLTVNDARTAIDDTIDTALAETANEAVVDALREITD